MAPLRERRVDIGLMIIHFLGQQGNLGRTPSLAPWIGSLALYSWPGNVRELRNVVQQMAIDQVPDVIRTPIESACEPLPHQEVTSKPKASYRDKTTVTEADIIVALDENDWSIKGAAEALNISRTILYELIDQAESIRRIEDIGDDEIKSTVSEISGGLNAWAKKLRVSKEPLRRRIKELSL
tara:strand:- start:668 stop:1213 length:546 start_codon:yes stop_codon:yes gene_type:complete